MNESVFEFGDSLNWDLAKRQKYTAQLAPGDDSRYIPLPDISLVLSSYILLIGTKNQKSKPTWWLGCRASVRLLVSPSSLSEYTAAVEVHRQNCQLGALSLVRIPYYKPVPYLLVLSVPRWHQELEIEVWQYSGPLPSDTPEASSGQLDRMERQIEFIANRDVRTEYDVDIDDQIGT